MSGGIFLWPALGPGRASLLVNGSTSPPEGQWRVMEMEEEEEDKEEGDGARVG